MDETEILIGNFSSVRFIESPQKDQLPIVNIVEINKKGKPKDPRINDYKSQKRKLK